MAATRLPRPWDSPGKNTGVGCHLPLQCMKVKSESEVAQSCPTLSDPMDCSLPGSPSMGFSRQEYWSGVPSHTPYPTPKTLPKQDRAPGYRMEEGNGVRLSGKETEQGSWGRGAEGLDGRFGVSPHSCCPVLPPPPSPILLCSLPFLTDRKEQTLYFLTDTCMVRQRADVNRGVRMVR